MLRESSCCVFFCFFLSLSLSAGSLCIPFLKLPQSLITLHNRQLLARHSGWLSIRFCSLTESVSCHSTEKSDKLKYPASRNERQPLCKCNFIYFFITVTPLLLQPTPWVLQQIMCCSHLFLTGVLQGPRWDHLRCHHHQLLSLMLSAVSLFKIIYQGEKNGGNVCFCAPCITHSGNRAVKSARTSFCADKMRNLLLCPAAVCPLRYFEIKKKASLPPQCRVIPRLNAEGSWLETRERRSKRVVSI